MKFKKLTSLLLVSALAASSLSMTAFSAGAGDANANADWQNEKSQAVDQNKDSDNDRVPDYLEAVFKTDPDKADTDGDGLSDYLEIYVLHTDPAKKDTDGNGVEDGDEDPDHDGLTNLQELQYRTDPTKSDTDGDGIKDGQEVSVYLTDPTVYDTDGDGLSDGEEAKLGLDPLKKSTDGTTPDAERLFTQTLGNDKIEEVLTMEQSPLVPSLTGTVPGLIDNNVAISVASKPALIENRTVIGEAIEVSSDYDAAYGMTLRFDYTNLLADADAAYAAGLTVCRYENEEFVPCDTVRGDNTIETAINAGGVYFVVNMDEFLQNMGVDLSSSSLRSRSRANVLQDSSWVLLDNYQYVKLDAPVSAGSDVDTDGDGVSDYEELGTLEQRDLTPFVQAACEAQGVPYDTYAGQTSVRVYSAVSNPTLADSDYDGINDNVDPKPQDNTFTGTLTTNQATSTVNYTMDYRKFFSSNESYSKDLSTASSLWSSAIYEGVTLNVGGSAKAIKPLMEYHGLSDVKVYKLSSAYSDYHLSELAIGHRKVSYGGTEKEVISVSVRGTNGTVQEWSSNFDIGDPNESPKTADWTIKANHKGFDVAATRLLRYINTYISSYPASAANKVIWVTGHSRGAAIANILGARLESAGYDTYTYTFAAPNTTTAANATTSTTYRSIFNIVNSDDFVPCLPMTQWGFRRYGRTANISIAKNYEKEWEALLSKFDYNPDTFGMQDTVNNLAAVATGRSDCYRYTCACHGDGSSDNITIINRGMSESSREKAIAKIPVNALPHCIITRYNGGLVSGWDFEVCQTPSYFMQLLAAQMSGEINAYRFAVELNIAKRYEKAKSSVIASAIGGLSHPHFQETYYLLATHVTSTDF